MSGIYAHSDDERIARSSGKDGNECDCAIRSCVDTINGDGESDKYEENSRLRIADCHRGDSYVPLLSETLHKIFIRPGQTDAHYESFLPKAFAPFFDAVENRFDDMVIHLSFVTQIFELLIYMPGIAHCDREKDLEW
jgi:hypothetical protein